MGKESRPKEQRNLVVYSLRIEGKTFKDIGKLMDISRQRAYQIYKRAEKLVAAGKM